MKVLLIKPPLNKISIFGDSLIEPLELEILASTIPDHECKILDMRIDTNLKKTLHTFQPDLVGITSYTTEVPVVRSLFSEVKRLSPHSYTVVGGCHASVMPEDFHHPDLDAVVVGSGELTFPELVNRLAHKKTLSDVRGLWIRENDRFVSTGHGNLLKTLNGLPEPKRQLTLRYRHRYYFGSSRPAATIMTSRGCPFRCSFCSIWRIMHGKYLTRDPEKVASELVGIQEFHVFIADDNTLTHHRHAEALAQSIRDSGIQKSYKMYGRADAIVDRPDIIEKWRDIGLKSVIMGLESFQDQKLESFNKKSTVEIQNQAIQILKDNDIKVRAYFIVDPEFTRDDFENLIEYIHNQEITEPMFTVLTPLPGTDFYEEVRDRMIIKQYEFFDLLHALLPTKLPRQEFYKKFSDLYLKSYPLKKILKKNDSSFCIKRLFWKGLFLLKFWRAILGWRYAYKVEEKYCAKASPYQSSPQDWERRPSKTSDPLSTSGSRLSCRNDPSPLGDTPPR